MTNYEKLFGTPEMVSNSLSMMLKCELGITQVHCDYCPLKGACCVYDVNEQELLEWLESEGGDD